MIDINLIPPDLRNNGKGTKGSTAINFPHEVLVGVGAGLIFLILTIQLLLGIGWLIEFGRWSVASAKWEMLLPDRKVVDAINDESKNLRTKIAMISDMTTKKSILWAPKFNAIGDSMSRGLWLRRMVLDKVSLSIDGSVVSKSQNEIANVGLFISSLKQDESFLKNFSSIEVNSIQRGKDNAVDVTDFTVTAKLK